MNMFSQKRINTFFVNNVDAYIPQVWAMESLLILEENMVASRLVKRDFSDEIAEYGDTVNTRKPANFSAVRKDPNDDVTDQDAVATNVPVLLNQLVHVSFVIRDAQTSKAFKDLVGEFVRPAMIAQAKFVDQALLGTYPQFLNNQTGQVGALSTSNVRGAILDTRRVMNVNLCPSDSRNMIWTPNAETTALSTDLFLQANQVGDDGDALRNATLGRKLDFQHYMSQDMGSVGAGAVNYVTGTGITTAAYAIGVTSLAISGLTAAIPAGAFITVDSRVYRAVSSTGGSTPSAVVIAAPGLVAAAASGVSVKVISAGAVNFASGYSAGYGGAITFNGLTNLPVVGQMVTFGTSTTAAVYVIVQATSTTIVLDRPLEASLSDATAMNVGPAGEYNLAFRENAIALVNRPLALPPEGVGAKGAVVSHNGVSMRAVLTYDGKKQGLRVTLDMLFGVKVLDVKCGSVMLG